MPPPRPEWVISAAIGATIAILLGAVVVWRLSDNSLLPTVESLGGPDNVDSAVPLPPAPEPVDSAGEGQDEIPIELPTEIEVEPEGSDEPAGSAAPSASAAESAGE